MYIQSICERSILQKLLQAISNNSLQRFLLKGLSKCIAGNTEQPKILQITLTNQRLIGLLRVALASERVGR
ncbi:hypothetical protein Cylst_4131 [Cylindrospermum stagnale PCC 7417]|uniref:Uncharacterized protein n=1 Tax=Cylindrospermum stagnale PCC 7417 TaxID=56107 RepID=K9X2F5_9NOST|nr:hypothetical protein Cylst_4131 [Cylindrospermum stagnale PCC 7417]